MGSGPGDPSSIEGITDRIVFHNEESGWSVIRLRIPHSRRPVTVVGTLLGIRPGESLRLWGSWVHDRRYGEQFRVESFVTMQPATLVGIEKYLGSGMIEGIGPGLAGRLVGRFGHDTLNVIEHHPERLLEVEGIGTRRAERIRRAWVADSEVRQVILFLQSHGVSSAYAARIFRVYGPRAIRLVRDNPYRLAADIPGIGFAKADRIASNLGIDADSPRRAEACVLHVLGEMAGEGHVYAPRDPLESRVLETLGKEASAEVVRAAVEEMVRRGEVILEAEAPPPAPGGGAGGGGAAYLRALYRSEVAAARKLRELLSPAGSPALPDAEGAVAWVEAREGIRLAPGQRAAVAEALRSKVVVVTGGPGTGKTTLVNALVRIFEGKLDRIRLCAPTGRASQRLREATGRDAGTIHRLLEFQPSSMEFQRTEERPLEADLVIVDEVSMVDVLLFASLLLALPPHCRLVLVGDVDQLPSVGPGCVLADVIAGGVVPVVRLREIFRQARESLIVQNAHRVNRGVMPVLRPSGGRGDFYFQECDDPEEAVTVIKRLVAERIPRRFGLRSPRDVQVLTPMHRGALGSIRLNQELQALLNPGDALPGLASSRAFRAGDKVMQVRNNYDLEVFNGDIGWIVQGSRERREVTVRFEGRDVRYGLDDLDDLTLAYACSIHKSQGNEFPAVVVPLHTQHYVMLRRNLLYTAITRGKKLVVIVGTRKALAIAVRNRGDRTRFSGLAARLRAFSRPGARSAPPRT